MSDQFDSTKLHEQAMTLGVAIIDGESDVQLRRRLHLLLAAKTPNRFTIDAISNDLDDTIEEHRPAFISQQQIKRSVALYWLAKEFRSPGFWARVFWLWRTACVLWRLTK